MQTQAVSSSSNLSAGSSSSSSQPKVNKKSTQITGFLSQRIMQKSSQEHNELAVLAKETLSQVKKDKKSGIKLTKEERDQYNAAQEIVKNQKKPIKIKVEKTSFSILSPHNISQKQKKTAWVKKGELLSHPVMVQNMKITEKFLATELGRKILSITEEYVQKSNLSISAKEWLLKLNFSEGTCCGQSYTLLCMMKRLKDKKAEICDEEFANYVLFFQTLEHLRVVWPQYLEAFIALFSDGVIDRPEKLAVDELSKATGLYRGEKHILQSDDKQAMQEALQKPSLKAVEIGMEGKRFSHSIFASFEERGALLYDLQTGFISYSKREDFISDFFNYVKHFENRQLQKNDRLQYVTFNSFTERKIEKSSTNSFFQSLHNLSREALFSA
jgi:hypothetical protein